MTALLFIATRGGSIGDEKEKEKEAKTPDT